MVKVFFLIFTLFLTSCAQRIKVPINRMMTPEVLGGGMGAEYQEVGFSSGQLDFSDDDTDNALIMSQVQERIFHLDLGPVDKMDIFADVPKESSTRVGVKVQILGEPEKKRKEGHLLAFTLATGSAQDTFDSDYEIKLKSNLEDYSIIHGYRFNENVMIYEGLSITSYTFKGNIENPGSLNSSTFKYSAENTLGLHAGVAFGATGIKAKAEIAAQQIKWSNTAAETFYSFGYSLMAYW